MKSIDVVSFIEECLSKGIEVPKGILFPISDYREHDSNGMKKDHIIYTDLEEGIAAKVTFIPERTLYNDIADRMIAECHRQDAKWEADRTHHPLEWNAILGEERGEVEKEINDNNWSTVQPQSYEIELEQLGAVAIQMIKSNMALAAKKEESDKELFSVEGRVNCLKEFGMQVTGENSLRYKWINIPAYSLVTMSNEEFQELVDSIKALQAMNKG